MSNNVKFCGGIVLVALGILLGLYVGVWVCFVGGIVDVIDQIRAESLSAMVVAWGIAKVVLAGLFGWVSAIAFLVPGFVLIGSGDVDYRRTWKL